ncbi:uncharacterized protein [Arachis hypogaea]|uniref:uncharacterized protein isoform X3 n=1 Tax=Arachis hypogaea TaxID=3818 RepID=UPI003B20BC67
MKMWYPYFTTVEALLETIRGDLGYHGYKAMFWYDPTSADLKSGLHPNYGDKEIRALQKTQTCKVMILGNALMMVGTSSAINRRVFCQH